MTAPREERVVDLMAALEASLNAAKDARRRHATRVRTWDLMPEHEARRLARELNPGPPPRRPGSIPPGFAACHGRGGASVHDVGLAAFALPAILPAVEVLIERDRAELGLRIRCRDDVHRAELEPEVERRARQLKELNRTTPAYRGDPRTKALLAVGELVARGEL